MKNNKVEMIHMHKTRKTKALVPLERALYLLHPYNASLITCKGRNEEINVMAVAWIVPVSVNPSTAGYEYSPRKILSRSYYGNEGVCGKYPNIQTGSKGATLWASLWT